MKYRVCIRCNETGEERMDAWNDYDWSADTDDTEGTFIFLWTEGNYSCDCNRELFYRRAGGEQPELDGDDSACGFTRFSAPWAEREDGSRLDIDTSTEPASGALPGAQRP